MSGQLCASLAGATTQHHYPRSVAVIPQFHVVYHRRRRATPLHRNGNPARVSETDLFYFRTMRRCAAIRMTIPFQIHLLSEMRNSGHRQSSEIFIPVEGVGAATAVAASMKLRYN